jgi:hypothetical protein
LAQASRRAFSFAETSTSIHEHNQGRFALRHFPALGSSARKAAHARGEAVNHQGDLGEGALIHKAIAFGFVVAKPYGHNHPYDFIVGGGSGFRSVQIKACAAMWHGL